MDGVGPLVGPSKRYDAFDRPLGAAPRGDWDRGPSQSNVKRGLFCASYRPTG